MELPTNIKDEIWDYCRANNIPNIDEFVLKLIRQGFTVEKYGATPAVTSAPLSAVASSASTVTVTATTETKNKTDLYGEDNENG